MRYFAYFTYFTYFTYTLRRVYDDNQISARIDDGDDMDDWTTTNYRIGDSRPLRAAGPLDGGPSNNGNKQRTTLK